ncbi:TetR/AcrR family transcriptional regulator [Schleiferilactobacillus perolens]|jgi:AcrR family transcriptional regulator|uniref:TetR family transcriptional regulator n=1 Tax=Schleiferilactobacillus perolens DSM 12744 TaxID=1423792 RepID=A0A0R1MQ64_9LACO|nr:TetR/AcrR family transcriptional regulator [Schleiferilactobacillus perolens]KRL10044.1 TetR family transcriptional regulator [Schleiferilactobacillus perolens DSM 12744]MCI1891050.1 TetR/AcrR family transcriptional regulator [Schleiferilactobacillus harbinensis]MCI1913385.1 TetR/AcrR family transcriptional regulator [Schleiferilactobacillus harbinensis]MCI2170375.1 TetR/AcrR family transcriptional regulator [Schleiferilactobacillus perolens]
MNQREKQKDATIQHILAAAQSLFMNRGYMAVTTRTIAEAAGVQQPLLYHYFGTKEKLYMAVVMHVSETMAAIIAQAQEGAGDFTAKLKRLGHTLTDDNPMNLQLVMHDVSHLDATIQQAVFEAWQKGFLIPLDNFFTAFQDQLHPNYPVRDITLYFLMTLAAYLRPAMNETPSFVQRQLPLDITLGMFCTGVLRQPKKK